MRRFGQLIPVATRLMMPQSPEDRLECLYLAASIRSIRILRADILHSITLDPPTVRIQFDDADPPERFWGKWLWSQVVTVTRVGWLMRLTEILPETRELFFSCVPDKVDMDLARKAADQGYPQIARITLGVFHKPYFRRFYLLN